MNKSNNFLQAEKTKSCSFTGHRPQKLPWGFDENDNRYKKTRKEVFKVIEQSILDGFKYFYSGMALGFDTMCVEILLELKNKHNDIQIFGAIPCKTQSLRWSDSSQIRYYNLLKQLDGVRCIYDSYEDGCMQERNKFMIDNSSLLIALYDGGVGGTKYTIDYARQKNLRIEIVQPCEK